MVSTSVEAGYFLTFAPAAVQRLRLASDETGVIDRAERALGTVPWHDAAAVAHWLVSEPFHAIVGLSLMADDPPSLAAARIREVLPEIGALSAPAVVSKGERATPLLDRVIRSLAFADAALLKTAPGSRSLVTVVLTFCEVSQGGSSEQREAWRARLGADMTLPNEDAAIVFEDVVRRVLGKAELSDDGRWSERARELIAASGLVAMRLRGEVGRSALTSLVEYAAALPPSEAQSFLAAWSIANAATTFAAAPEAWSNELCESLRAEEQALMLGPFPSHTQRTNLGERLARMRGGPSFALADRSAIEAALDRLGAARALLESRLVRCRVWHARSALEALSLEGVARLLLFAGAAAVVAGGVDTTDAWHLDLLNLQKCTGAKQYGLHLVETLLRETTIEQLLAGRVAGQILKARRSSRGGEPALELELDSSAETGALLTLLPFYAERDPEAFHKTLASLCAVQGIEKVAFDRFHTAAASAFPALDLGWEALFEYVRAGTIVLVESAPESELAARLRERFIGSRVFSMGLDTLLTPASSGASFEPNEVTTVVLSEVCWSAASTLEKLDAVVAAAFRVLAPGGRLLARDRVAAEDVVRVVEPLDAGWGSLLERTANLPGSRWSLHAADGKLRMSAQDLDDLTRAALSGEALLPYALTQPRPLLTRAALLQRLVTSASDAKWKARELDVPTAIALDTPAGYRAAVSNKMRVLDDSGADAPIHPLAACCVLEKIPG